MRRVVIDTNILIRALLKGGGSDEKIYRLFVDREVKLFFSLEMIDEFLRVIYYPRVKKRAKFTHDQVELFIKRIRVGGKIVAPQITDLCRDTKDNVVLGTAMAARGKGRVSLITGDDDLLELKGKVEGVEIVTPREFLQGPL